jgi:hypothetical protein
MNRFDTPARRAFAAAVRALARHAATASCIAVVAGCAHPPCPPFRAAWYVDLPEGAAAAAAPTMYLALLNDSTQAYRVERVVLNPSGTDRGGVDVLQGNEVARDPWQPGRLRLIKLETQELSTCHLPVAVRLHCGNGLATTQAVSGLLPNYLPQHWIDQCVRPDIK